VINEWSLELGVLRKLSLNEARLEGIWRAMEETVREE
jgi:hypothetical protein